MVELLADTEPGRQAWHHVTRGYSHPFRRRRRAHPHGGQARSRRRGLDRRRSRQRRGGHRPVPPRPARCRADRHHAPGHRRVRAVPHPAPSQRRADRDGDGPQRHPRRGRRPRGRRRRLPHQAVRTEGAVGAHPRPAAPHSARSARRTPRLVFGDLEIIPDEGKVLRSRVPSCTSPRPSSGCCASWPRTPAVCSAGRACSTRCGATTTSATAGWSTCTSAACAPRSRPTPPTLATSSPCAASGIAFSRDHRARDRRHRAETGCRQDCALALFAKWRPATVRASHTHHVDVHHRRVAAVDVPRRGRVLLHPQQPDQPTRTHQHRTGIQERSRRAARDQRGQLQRQRTSIDRLQQVGVDAGCDQRRRGVGVAVGEVHVRSHPEGACRTRCSSNECRRKMIISFDGVPDTGHRHPPRAVDRRVLRVRRPVRCQHDACATSASACCSAE